MNIKTREIYLYWFHKYKKYIKNNNIESWIDFAKENYSISTQRVIAASMRYYLDENFQPEGQGYRTKINIITQEEFEYLLENIIADDFIISNRQKHMLKIMWNTGIRISEMLNLKWEDVSHRFIFIKGKGNKMRSIPYQKELFNNIERDSEYVISSRGKKMSYSNAYKEFKKFAKILGYEWFSPHTIRHSFASRLVSKNLSIEYLSRIMGHASINTTMIYIHFKEESIREFLEKI